MDLGYRRTLQATDLWKMDESRSTKLLSEALDKAWEARTEAAREFNSKLDMGEIKPSRVKKLWWKTARLLGRRVSEDERLKRWRESQRKHPSLVWALNDVLWKSYWIAGAFRVFGDFSQMTAPLLVKAIINFGKAHFAATHPSPGVPPTPPPSLVKGIFMAVGLFILSMNQNIGQQQFFWRSTTTGVSARAALVGCIYKRGIYLTPAARKKFDNSKLVHYVSGDVSRVETAAQWFHAAWTTPLQVGLCFALLIVQLGPSALAGGALFLLLAPLQRMFMWHQAKNRANASQWSDKRMSLMSECIQGMKVIKWFCYENQFIERITLNRNQELRNVLRIQLNGAGNLAVAFTMPVIAAVVSFAAFLFTKHDFDVAIIFSSLALFNLLRTPLQQFPRAMISIADAQTAFQRLTPLFEAPIHRADVIDIDRDCDSAVSLKGASFAWETSGKPSSSTKRSRKQKEKITPEKTGGEEPAPFSMTNISIEVARGTLVAIAGPVGSGKSSLLQGMIGEMRRTSGLVKFGGNVAYCSQVSWIQNATLRENILFGKPFQKKRYWQVIEQACLLPDLELLNEGDLTEIGEKGINLSGGQKQRVNIARALYHDADILILDDPLSAVDAHVGKDLFSNAILHSVRSAGKTVILVTHALHFMSQVDYIYTLDNGAIVEQGRYEELMSKMGKFYELITEFAGKTESEEKTTAKIDSDSKEKPTSSKSQDQKNSKPGQGLMSHEKRTTGSLPWKVYIDYFTAGQGWLSIPTILLCAILMQSSQVLNSYLLIWWQADSFHLSEGTYAAIYASLGISQATFAFLLGGALSTTAKQASYHLHNRALHHIFRSPVWFFESTPMGRLLGIFGKDLDSIDNQLIAALRLWSLTMSGVFGSLIIISILENYFIIAVVVIGFGYNYFAAFYRASAREMKRLDSMLRSLLYSHFSESLYGLPTIKAYGAADLYISDNHYYVDLENRALFMTYTTQRWLSFRLSTLGSGMTFIVALLAVLGISGISPGQIGLILTYTTSLTQMLTVVTRQSAEVENNMNSVERVFQYSNGEITTEEAPQEIPQTKPQRDWPSQGSMRWENVSMSYRPNLPVVLQNINLDIRAGEKVGIVGRTGAGKTSLVTALFRLVELKTGSIYIDGVDISTIGLKDLRSNLSIIPQEPLLFSGTIRSNLDPFSQYDDATLWNALRRAHLVDTSNQEPGKSRFTLETIIETEGLNLSVGERSLLSLARALVRENQIVVLDEATASVDLETDAKIQKTIQSEFQKKTLLCIAHRLRTILAYDRILVMDKGSVAEFDTALQLYDRSSSIFRGLCDESNVSRDEIVRSTNPL